MVDDVLRLFPGTSWGKYETKEIDPGSVGLFLLITKGNSALSSLVLHNVISHVSFDQATLNVVYEMVYLVVYDQGFIEKHGLLVQQK